ncbi:hypothetical protein LTR64_004050 [Lithohypha guttulata]|uniref:uncharacterized protein n=1 Tax=Lithohypha guttulata TaxID=1690604 RepID=UPI002DE0D633|nr:hypothetical protein LTR51_006656 [Lithohypha guttulata]
MTGQDITRRQSLPNDHDTANNTDYRQSTNSAFTNGINSSSAQDQRDGIDVQRAPWRRLYSFITYTPARCRYDPEQPLVFSNWLNVLFACAGCITVANLYYTHPILNLFARDFDVTDQEASYIPTLAQAGYAVGLFLLNPPGDLLRRRPYILLLVWITATLWIGLCITTNFQVFLVLTFLTGLTTVTPQLMMPLVGELAPKDRKATALSIVVSGLLLGILVARLLSGVVALYIGWRYIYWIAFGLQYIVLILLWFFMPDYPSTNPQEDWLSTMKAYPWLLWDIVRLIFQHPVLAQSCLIGLFSSAAFTSFWTTLTFLLAGPPYRYDSLVIGLFALIGIGAMSMGPVFARTVMDKRQPIFGVIVGTIINLLGCIIGTFVGRSSVVGPILQAAFTDIGLQTSQIGNRTGIYAVEPLKRNRVNTAYMLGVFFGQLMGTGVGNAVYARGGWVHSGAVNIALVGFGLLLCFVKGPHDSRWFGYQGGWNMKVRHLKEERNNEDVTHVSDEKPGQLPESEGNTTKTSMSKPAST